MMTMMMMLMMNQSLDSCAASMHRLLYFFTMNDERCFNISFVSFSGTLVHHEESPAGQLTLLHLANTFDDASVSKQWLSKMQQQEEEEEKKEKTLCTLYCVLSTTCLALKKGYSSTDQHAK